MKKLFVLFSLLIISLLSSCSSNTTLINIDIIYNDNLYENINFKGINTSCALYNEKTKVSYSGTFIEKDSNDYFIISSSNLGQINDKIIVYTNNIEIPDGEIIGLDSKNGLSLIKLNTTYDIDCVNIQSNMYKGETIYAVSTPLGISKNESSISQINKGIISRIDGYYINIDCSLNENSYGCGIYNKNGDLIAIMIDKIYTDTLNSYFIQGMSYAISSDYLIKSYQNMKEYGNVIRPQFGITVMEYHESLNEIYTSLYPDEGYENLVVPSLNRTYIIIKEVVENSNSYNILNKGDIILSINDKDIYHTNDISSIINFLNINDKVNITISRYNDKTKSFEEYTYNICLLLNNQS